MAKTKLLGEEREKHLKEQKKLAKKKNRRKRRTPARFFKDIWSELKKVTWPTKKELISYSLAVLAFILILAIVTGAIDLGLEQLLSLLVV